MIVAPTRELAVQVGRVANELLSHSPKAKQANVALLIEESGSGGEAAPAPLASIAAPVLVGTAKVILAEMQKCNGTVSSAAGRKRLQEGEEREKEEREKRAKEGSEALGAVLKDLKAVVIDEVCVCA
jgi:surface antigen